MVQTKWHIWAAAVAVIFFCFSIGAKASEIEQIEIHLEKNQIAISFINLPDGEATLIHSNQKNILINSGANDSKVELKKQLKKMNIDTINTLILTSPDPSYMGNANQIAKQFKVKKVMTSQSIKKQSCSKHLNTCRHITVLDDKKSYRLLPHLNMKVFEQSKRGDLNLFFTYGNNTMYYMGFSDKDSQTKLLHNHPFKAAILKLSNYGEGFELNQEFLKTLDPEMAVLFHKKDSKPNEDFLNRLSTEWVETYRLEYVGTLTLQFTPESYEVVPFFKE